MRIQIQSAFQIRLFSKGGFKHSNVQNPDTICLLDLDFSDYTTRKEGQRRGKVTQTGRHSMRLLLATGKAETVEPQHCTTKAEPTHPGIQHIYGHFR